MYNYAKIDNGVIKGIFTFEEISVSDEYTKARERAIEEGNDKAIYDLLDTFTHFKDMTKEEVELLADYMTKKFDVKYMVSDTPTALPRYEVFKSPQIGDKISCAFNGDYKPDETIKSISKTMKVITSTSGRKYYRKGETSKWINNGVWVMIQGHINRRNMEF